MGVISILLGIITFFCFTGAGAVAAMKIVEAKEALTKSIVTLDQVSNNFVTAHVILVFAFIGFFIGMNLFMHGATYRKSRGGNTSLSYICIVLGIIALCCLAWMGFQISSMVVEQKNLLALFPGLTFLGKASGTVIFSVISGFFSFIGLLICMNMTMHGLTYKKVARVQGLSRNR